MIDYNHIDSADQSSKEVGMLRYKDDIIYNDD
jgi:hypothetical protein